MSLPSRSAEHPLHFYRPHDHAQTPEMRSPDYVQLSTAAAITLGLLPGTMHRTGCTHCLNLLVTYPEGCRANCSYCGLARHREKERAYVDRNFIRVDWPTVHYEEVIRRVQERHDAGAFERMCISMITHPDSGEDTLQLLDQWVKNLPHIPVSILSNPTTMEYADLVELKQRGADIFTVALDATTPEIFERTRGKTVQSPHRWDRYWQAIEWAAEIYGPEKFGAHLICGMGETEQDILEVCQRLRSMGGHNHMFAFFPEQGSMMEDWQPVARDQWRRVQVGRFLIDYHDMQASDMVFDRSGKLVDFGLDKNEIEQIIASGIPFQTSGCPGQGDQRVSACNRPYGDSSPADIYSFPFALETQDVRIIERQLAGEKIGTYVDES